MPHDSSALTRRQALRGIVAGAGIVAGVKAAASTPPRRPDHPTIPPAIIALRSAVDTLAAFRRGCCGDSPMCFNCLDCHAAEASLRGTLAVLGSESSWTPRLPSTLLPAAATAATPHEGAILALCDALDALLDVSAYHCGGESCPVCEAADVGLYPVRLILDTLRNDLMATQAVEGRLCESAARKIERRRRVEFARLGWLPHAGGEHRRPEQQLRHAQEMLAMLAEQEGGEGA